MKRSTMTATAAILIGLTGVAIAQQDIITDDGMMVEGGEEFSYAGTWGEGGYARNLGTVESDNPWYGNAQANKPVAAAAAEAAATRKITTAPITPVATTVTATTSKPAPTLVKASTAPVTTTTTRPAVRYSTTSSAPITRTASTSTTRRYSMPTELRPVTTISAAPTQPVLSQPLRQIVAPAVTTTRTTTQTAAAAPAVRYSAPAPIKTASVRTVSAPKTTTTRTFTAPKSVNTRAPAPTMRRMAATAPPSPMDQQVPNGNVGDCFARIMIPAKYNEVSDTLTVQDGYDGLVVSQAEFETDVERVKVRDESIKYVVRQPKFRTEMAEVTVKPAYERLHVQPAQWEYVSETVKVSEPRLVWKAGSGLSGITRVDPKTGVTYCLVEEDAETKRVQKRVMTQAEQVRASMVPEQVVTVAKQVLIDKGGVTEVTVPAVFREVPVQRLLRKASADRRNVAAREQQITKRVLQSAERFEWVAVMCETNITPGALVSIQKGLKDRGYYKGPIDGIFGNQSVAALAAFQNDRNIVHAGYLTVDTLKALGLSNLSGHTATMNSNALAPKTKATLRGFTSAAMVGSQASAGATAEAGAAMAVELSGGPQGGAPVAAEPAGPILNRNSRRNAVMPAMTDVGPSSNGFGDINVVVAPQTQQRPARYSTPAPAPVTKTAPTPKKTATPMRRRLTWAGRTK